MLHKYFQNVFEIFLLEKILTLKWVKLQKKYIWKFNWKTVLFIVNLIKTQIVVCNFFKYKP